MTFDLETWKEKTTASLHKVGQWLERRKNEDAPYLLYGYLGGLSLWPLVAAAQADQLLPAVMALGSVAGGIGGNLLANQVQKWTDQAAPVTETEVVEWVAENSAANPELRLALDAILKQLDVVAQAQAQLGEADRQWFSELLRAELARLGNLAHFEAELSGTGAIAQGPGARAAMADRAGIAVAGDVGRDVHITHLHGQLPSDPEQARLATLQHRYLERFAHYCNVLPLGDLGGDKETGEEISLEAVYVSLDTKTRVPRSEEDKSKLPGQNERPLSAMEVAIQEKKLVLVGDPGSGKSTFVRQLAGRLASNRLGQREDLPSGWQGKVWPMLTTLRNLTPRLAELDLANVSTDEQDRRLVEVVYCQWQADLTDLRVAELAARLDDVLAEERLLVIFDGLDEVPENLRRWVRQAVWAVLKTYHTIERVIVTCRVRSYTGPAVLSGFAKHELAPFDEAKIERFVHCWYNAQRDRLGQTEANKKAQDLRRAVFDRDLRRLAQNPMLLTTMAIIHQQEVGLPRERVRLYNLAVQVLLSRWQRRKGLMTVSPPLRTVLDDDRQIRSIMELIAYQIHAHQAKEGESTELARGQLVTLLDGPRYLGETGLANDFLDYVDKRAGLLVGRGGGGEGQKPQTYDFPHRTFQEYLAGCYMVTGRGINREYQKRVAEGDYWYVAGRLGAEELFYNNPRGEQLLLDLAYTLCPKEEPAEIAQWRAVLWSGQMAVVLGRERIENDPGDDLLYDNGPAYLARLLPRLKQILTNHILTAVERVDAGQVLAHLGDDRSGVGLRSDGLPDIAWCEVPAGPFVMGSPDDSLAFFDSKETPQRQVDLPAFRISQYPITNAQYRAFVKAGGYQEVSYWTEAARAGYWREGQVKRLFIKGGEIVEEWAEIPAEYGSPFNLANHPVVGINWYEAVAYTHWLTVQLRQAGQLGPDEMITLPSESQWEKAARGPEGRVYPWGDEPDPNRANYGDTGIGTTSAVGCFPGGASPYGGQDMSGNVWEWCRTRWQASYRDYQDDNDLEGKAPRVVRGGAFYDIQGYVRCAVRHGFVPDLRYDVAGFRVVWALSPSTSGL